MRKISARTSLLIGWRLQAAALWRAICNTGEIRRDANPPPFFAEFHRIKGDKFNHEEISAWYEALKRSRLA